MNNPLRHIGSFVAIILFQVLILNNVNVDGLVNPYIYPIFILLLPLEIGGWLLLLLAFFTGISIDLFMGTIGIHAFASVFIAGMRPTIVNLISQKGTDQIKPPSLNIQGFSWMLVYTSILVSAHHIVYFFLEAGTFGSILTTLLRIVCSTVVSIFMIFLLLYAFKKTKKKGSL